MSTARYEPWRPGRAAQQVVAALDEVCRLHLERGVTLTLGQAFYRLVAVGVVENTPAAQKRFGTLSARARRAGLLDCDLLADHTWRYHPQAGAAVSSAPLPDHAAAAGAVASPAPLLEIWVEKEPLGGIVGPAAAAAGAAWLACRGYPSLTELHHAARRHTEAVLSGRPVRVLFLGDHDRQGHGVEAEIRTQLHTMLATHWVDAHLSALPRRRGVAMSAVEEAMARHLDGAPALRVERVALTAAHTLALPVPPDPAGDGHELEAADPIWLSQQLATAIGNHTGHHTGPAATAVITHHPDAGRQEQQA